MKITNQSTLTSKITLPDTTVEDVTTNSNESNTEHMTLSLLKVLSSNKTYLKPEEEAEQTIKLTNNSDYTVSNISIKTTLTGATFKTGTVTIDGTAYESYDPTVGFTLPNDLVATSETTIKYTITANAITTMTNETNVTDIAEITYSVNEITDLKENTNELVLPVTNNVITLTKTSDKSAVISGQTLMYQIVIQNSGNIKNTNLNFKDTLPSSVTFVEDSVTVDGIAKAEFDPVAGFDLDDLDVASSTTVRFNVTVN